MKRSLIIIAASFLIACSGETDPTAAPSSFAVTLAPADAAKILDFVNYPGNDLDVFDHQVGLDVRAARDIVAARDGADGISPSDDDVYFATIAQLDATPYVGDAAFQKLAAYAAAHPAPAGETVEGVLFQGWQSEAVVWGVNNSSVELLDSYIDTRAAAGLVAKRPFASVAAMGPVAWVGATALDKLRSHSVGWWNQERGSANLAGRFDGAVFDEGEAEIALQIVNQATAAQLTAHGIAATPANHIIAGRPYASLAPVAALSGVGSATLNALLAYAQSGQWGASCVANFDDAVGPHLGDLLFLSESDRPFDLVSFAGAGGSAPTGASLLALVGAPAGSTAEVRPTGNYYVDFEPSSSSADPNAGAAVQAAIAAQLTDVLYVAIHAPAGSVNQALVDVYLVGRTSCGDLVGLHSISVET